MLPHCLSPLARWQLLDFDADLLCCVDDLPRPVAVGDLAMESAHIADDVLGGGIERDFDLAAAGCQEGGVDGCAGQGEPMLGLEVRLDDRDLLPTAEVDVSCRAVVRLVVRDERHRLKLLTIHAPGRGAMGEEDARGVGDGGIAEVGGAAGDEMEQDAGGDIDEIGLAVGHIAVVVDERQCHAGHDAGVAGHATVGGHGSGVVLAHQLVEDPLEQKRLGHRFLGNL